MNLSNLWKSLLTCLLVIVVIFIGVSILDIILSVLYARFYSDAAFIVTFGVGGVFAGVLGYMYGIDAANEKNETARWSLIIFLALMGVVFFFPLSAIGGGEYLVAFKAYGITMALSGFIFVKGKVD
jgi:hypothetical protein